MDDRRSILCLHQLLAYNGTMSINLVKLCVGAESLEDLQHWSIERLRNRAANDEEARLFHTTRMMPKRADELLDGGSLYWVIKGKIQARQTLTEIRPFVDSEGIRRCKLMLGDDVIPTQWQPKRAFQGWRYLKVEDAPSDLQQGEAAIPVHLRAELAELGLL